eukprot:15453326-Alexandrium_andersonii.AAC.1
MDAQIAKTRAHRCTWATTLPSRAHPCVRHGPNWSAPGMPRVDGPRQPNMQEGVLSRERTAQEPP